jgi:polar amino acid transport system substrate-binding protein
MESEKRMRTSSKRQPGPWKGLFLLGLAVLFPWSCIGEIESGLDRIARTGVLRVGTDATYPPFESIDTASGDVIGFDIDLVGEICRELGCAPEYIVVPFDGIIAGLGAGKYDLIASTFTITPERATQVAYTEPYYDGGQALVVPTYNTTIEDADDLLGLRIGVQLGTTGERRAHLVPDAEIISFENIGAAFIDMENGHLDAIISDMPIVQLIIVRRPNAKIVGPPLTAEDYGFAVRLGDDEFLGRVDQALEKIKTDGRYQAIHDRWFGTGG